MAAIDELEAQLRTAWDPSTAAVYADVLQTAGDPRGELIALDLQLDAHGQTAALVEARRAAIERWLGTPSANLPACVVRCGLLDVVLIADLKTTAERRTEALLGCPGIGHLRSLTLCGDARDVQSALSLLTARPHPWLERLVLDQDPGGVAPRRLVEALEAAAPQLRTLELRGRAEMASLPAQVRRLAIDARDTYVAMRGNHVVELDFAFDESIAPPSIARLLDAFPRLQRLDLSRNEPGFSRGRSTRFDPLVWLGGLDHRDQLRSLRLPALRLDEQRSAILALLDAHPALTIELARGYRTTKALTADLAHPRLTIPPPRPWPSPERFSGRGAYQFELSGYAQSITPSRCIELLEPLFDALPPAARDSWTTLWKAMARLDNHTTRTVPVAVLASAVESVPVDLSFECHDVARMLRDAALPADTPVTMRRVIVPSVHCNAVVRERERLGMSRNSYLARRWVDDDTVYFASDIF